MHAFPSASSVVPFDLDAHSLSTTNVSLGLSVSGVVR